MVIKYVESRRLRANARANVRFGRFVNTTSSKNRPGIADLKSLIRKFLLEVASISHIAILQTALKQLQNRR